MAQHRWDKPSLILHFIFAAAVVSQLITSQFMGAHANLFYLHVAGGITALVMLLIYVALKLKQNRFMSFYPHTIMQFIDLKNDIVNLIKFRAMPDRAEGGLPGLVQGLGILLILGMAITGLTGFVIYHWLPWKQAASIAISIHTTLATFVWIYIIGHTAMSCVHWMLNYRNRPKSG
ncbi:MAG: cytochrome b/b6 domain-containing protein [Gammaproteobacteria bacterium]|nr:cytochrome b/b6 domain-containing protein [Gammaproteobacteria bacterium]